MNPRSEPCFPSGRRVVAALLAIHALLLSTLAYRNAANIDELGHLAAGIDHWRTGRFGLYHVNPPAVRLIATIPVLAMNPVVDYPKPDLRRYSRPEFVAGVRYMQANGPMTRWHVLAGRLMLIPFSLLGAYLTYQWSKELFGKPAGTLALVLWTFSPTMLTWGATMLPDMGATALCVTASYAFWRHCRSLSFTELLFVGLLLGFSMLTKHTVLAVTPVWCLILLCTLRGEGLQRVFLTTVGRTAIIGSLACLVVNLGYGFEGTGTNLGDYRFISTTLGGEGAHETPSNRFLGTAFESIPIPLPANYVQGSTRRNTTSKFLSGPISTEKSVSADGGTITFTRCS